MKKLNRRALSVMMISLFIILGLFTYIERFLRDGESWASYFSRLNSLSEGYVTDRNGVLLAAFTANDNSFNEDRNTRIANYHVTGDFWNRTGSGILTNFARQLHGYSPVTGQRHPHEFCPPAPRLQPCHRHDPDQAHLFETERGFSPR